MKKNYFFNYFTNIIIMYGLVICFIFSCAQKKAPRYVYYPDPSLSKDNRIVTENSIVFLGDSFTHMQVWKDAFPESKTTNLPEFQTSAKIIFNNPAQIETANQGIGGNRTNDVLERLDNIILKTPKKIFLLIGANDITGGVEKNIIINNISLIIQKIIKSSPKTHIYVESIFPFGKKIGSRSDRYKYRDTILDLNKQIQELCVNFDVTYIDVHSYLAEKSNFLREELTCDQLHLTQQGFDTWANVIRPYVLE